MTMCVGIVVGSLFALLRLSLPLGAIFAHVDASCASLAPAGPPLILAPLDSYVTQAP